MLAGGLTVQTGKVVDDFFLALPLGFPSQFRPLPPSKAAPTLKGDRGSSLWKRQKWLGLFLPIELQNFRHQCPPLMFRSMQTKPDAPSSRRERSPLSVTLREEEWGRTSLPTRPRSLSFCLPASSLRARPPRRKRSPVRPEIGGAVFTNPVLASSRNPRET